MARRNVAVKREVLPDPKFNSKLVSKFINSLTYSGKKSIAQRILYDSIDRAGERLNEEGIEVFHQAISNVKPVLEIRPRRVGGATYQVPVDVRAERRVTLAIRWLVDAARNSRGERTMAQRLAAELIDAFNNEGIAIRKKQDQHRMAEANRAFAHYRW
ncbi:30S ribosomal protein S7 [Candidatus Poribacteria bacterium]|jgi:small subunit ribosomal protein S7|nr:30S ribosomal protein S7 [Candidatus Poribacteria bacterium]MEE2912070.1 30S ribosomal protein S7 [Candidatus Poribacteria bacterium]